VTGLSPDDLISKIDDTLKVEGIKITAPPKAADDGGTTTSTATKDATGEVDLDRFLVTDKVRRLFARGQDRSVAHQALVRAAVESLMSDDLIVEMVSHFKPSKEKYGDRLEAETRRSIAAALKDIAEHRDEDGTTDDDGESSWVPIDLSEVVAGKYQQPTPTVLRRDDEAHLFYVGHVNGAHGDSGTGKGWVMCLTIKQELDLGRAVIYIDMEDTAQSIVARLLMIGTDPVDIAERLIYIRPSEPFYSNRVGELCEMIRDRGVRLCIIDSVGEAFGIDGINEDRDNEVGPWIRKVARPLAEAGAAVVLVDHSTKAADNPLHPSGSKRKRAAITGASYLVEATRPLVKGEGGRLRLTCAKDRHGNYRRKEIVAHIEVVPGFNGAVEMKVIAPSKADNDETLPVLLCAKAAVKAAKAEGSPVSRSALQGLMKIKASTDAKRAGIDLAEARHALAVDIGPRKAQMYRYVQDLPDEVK
jgi:hypothetical protein